MGIYFIGITFVFDRKIVTEVNKQASRRCMPTFPAHMVEKQKISVPLFEDKV